jgi:hypothetical protein
VGASGYVDAYLGADRMTRVAVAAWRLASLASGLALVAPIMNVGRRPYRLGRLTERLKAVQDMAVIPDALPTELRWLQFMVIATVVTGIVLPLRYRLAHPVVSVPALVLAVLVWRGADQSDWTTPRAPLMVSIVLLSIAVVAALHPILRPWPRPRA